MSIPQHVIGTQKVGVVGYGTMNLTWKPQQTPDEQAFACLKTAIDAGATFINSGEFYGHPVGTMGLSLLSRFYAAEPEYAKKVFLSVKGGLKADSRVIRAMRISRNRLRISTTFWVRRRWISSNALVSILPDLSKRSVHPSITS